MRGGGQRRLAPAWLTAKISGAGGRLRGGAAGELVAAAYAAESAHGPRLAHGLSLADLAHAVALVEGGDLRGEDGPRAAARAARAARDPRRRFPWDPVAGDAFNSREAELERRVGRSAAGWLSAGRPRRESFRVGAPADRPRAASATCTTRCSTRRGARPARTRHADGARHRLHLPAAGAADDGRPPAADLRLPGAARRRAAARPVRGVRAERRRRRRQRGLALGARPRRGSPSCSAPTASSSTPRTPPGSRTSTSSCSRRSRSPRPTRASSARTSRSTRARSSGSSSSPTRTAARAR